MSFVTPKYGGWVPHWSFERGEGSGSAHAGRALDLGKTELGIRSSSRFWLRSFFAREPPRSLTRLGRALRSHLTASSGLQRCCRDWEIRNCRRLSKPDSLSHYFHRTLSADVGASKNWALLLCWHWLHCSPRGGTSVVFRSGSGLCTEQDVL